MHQVCDDIVYRGNLLKFTQNPTLRNKLLDTGEKLIVEVLLKYDPESALFERLITCQASPTDRIWGIGLAAADPRALDPSTWQVRLVCTSLHGMQTNEILGCTDVGGINAVRAE